MPRHKQPQPEPWSPSRAVPERAWQSMDALRAEYDRRCAESSAQDVELDLLQHEPDAAERLWWRRVAWEILDAAGASDVSRCRSTVMRVATSRLGMEMRRPSWVSDRTALPR